MTTFSTATDELLEVVAKAIRENRFPFQGLAVIRDLKGVLRVVLHANASSSSASTEIERLAEDLEDLGKWFSAPILCDKGQGEKLGEAKIAELLWKKAQAWNVQPPLIGVECRKLERRLSKGAWDATEVARLPWPLLGANPPIVAFFSFKGGVGRTTALAGVAALLANEGHSVAVIDLDLEAPGLGPFLDVSTTRGVVDVLVDHAVTGRADTTGGFAPIAALPKALSDDGAGRIQVLPAGDDLNDDYLEKLGRLDFHQTTFAPEESPVRAALESMLKVIKTKFDFILLDARAGFHDLGGLALQGLAHIDVMVARPSAQTKPGLRLALTHLNKVRGDDMQVIVAHAQAPSDPDAAEHSDLQAMVYGLFDSVVYVDWDNAPALTDTGAMHEVVPIAHDKDLVYLKNAHLMPLQPFEGLKKRIEERVRIMRDTAKTRNSGGGTA
jgi:Mrp family chromosome partitioning ATPase